MKKPILYDPRICSKCGTDNSGISMPEFDSDSDDVYGAYTCPTCGTNWSKTYHLSRRINSDRGTV